MPAARDSETAGAPIQVLAVASEMYPFVKTGGLADVVGALPSALAPLGVAVRTLLPGYPALAAAARDGATLAHWDDFFGGTAWLREAAHDHAQILVLDAPHLFARKGNPYLDASGRDWPDNAQRFAALALAAASIAWGDAGGELPDLLHAHDWQAALVPAYLHYLGRNKRRPATVLTLHNLAFQG